MVGKAPVYRLSRSKAPKTQQICHYRHTRKTSELFLLFNTGVNFSLRNNFANSGSFAKVSVPVHIYNSLIESNQFPELSYQWLVDQILRILFTLHLINQTNLLWNVLDHQSRHHLDQSRHLHIL